MISRNMYSKGYVALLAPAIALLMLIPGIIILPDPVTGTPAEVIAYILDPTEPKVDLPLNVTVEFNIYDEPLTTVNIQWCIFEPGGGGLCGPMNTMVADASGRNYSYDYPAYHFENQTYEFHIYEFNIDTLPIHAILVHMARDPEYIVVNATMEPNTIHPNETVTVSGDLITDLGEPIEDAEINLSIADLDVFNTTESNLEGGFFLDLEVPGSGYFIVNLTATWEDIVGYMDFQLTVSEWTLPTMSIIGTGLSYDPLEAPPGAPTNTFYADANITLGYEVGNSGNDEATNITAEINVNDILIGDVVEIGGLQPGQRYAGEVELTTNSTGHFKVNITASWDQTAPFPDGFELPFYKIEYDIVPRPEWTGHTVFVEMFTQTSCAPCVYIEESLELLNEEGLNFEYVVYVVEDTASGLIAQGLNITTTPVLFVDDGLFRKDSSSSDLDFETGEIKDMIEDAASLERAPVSVEFLNSDDLTISSYLDPQYRESVSGIIEIYKIETYSNLRNFQGIPMSHRYLGSIAGKEVNELQPGNWFNFSVEAPLDGEGLIAVLKDDDGSVIQTASYLPEEHPEIYLQTDQTVLNIESPGKGTFAFTIDRFAFEQENFDVEFLVTESGFPTGWSIAYKTGTLAPPGVMMILSSTGSTMETKEIGRIRYYQDYEVTVTVPANETGPFDFTLAFKSENFTYSMQVVVIVPEPSTPEIEITNYYLYGEGKAIYFQVDATDIPDGATVKGKILPCDYGEGASCGLPEYFIMTKISEGSYRASVLGVDLTTFTHLTYSAWVEYEGTTYAETEEIQVEISSLVTIEDDDDEPVSPWIFIFSILGLLVAMALAIILFLLAKRSKEEEEPPIEEVIGESYEDQSSEGEVALEKDGEEKEAPSEEGPEDQGTEEKTKDSEEGSEQEE
jgi:thiol-disulfide isomerase/thioredoxin